VQQAVNRVQPFEVADQVVGWCRALGFALGELRPDLRPAVQTAGTMADTLEKCCGWRPIASRSTGWRVIPDMFRWQNTFREADCRRANCH
jgi:hypothetical protein